MKSQAFSIVNRYETLSMFLVFFNIFLYYECMFVAMICCSNYSSSLQPRLTTIKKEIRSLETVYFVNENYCVTVPFHLECRFRSRIFSDRLFLCAMSSLTICRTRCFRLECPKNRFRFGCRFFFLGSSSWCCCSCFSEFNLGREVGLQKEAATSISINSSILEERDTSLDGKGCETWKW